MCGIVGICNGRSAPEVTVPMLEAMTTSIKHRGPDGDGFYVRPWVGLGHRRLSIIDLEGGDQPIYGANGSLVIVFNGEIYNYKELRENLVAAGYHFATQSDTEVIVHLFDQLGSRCVEQLNGMFSFAIWDERNQSLFVARDRLGEKPLYYTHAADGTFIFSSEIKAIRATNHSRQLSLDSRALDDFLAYGYVPAPRSIYQEIKKLPGAHTATWCNGKLEINQYWSHLTNQRMSSADMHDSAQRLEELLVDSIRLRLRSDVPVGAFLSGGIDSSLIVAIASEVASSPISTYSVGFAERDFDESEFARQVAIRCGTDHHEILVGEMNLDFFPDLVRQFDEPFADPSALPTYYVTKAAANHLKVCLSGDGGDELFVGYPQYVLEPGEQLFGRIPPRLRKLMFGLPASVLPDHVRGKGWLSRMASSRASRYQKVIGVFDNSERRRLLNKDYGLTADKGADLLAPYFINGRSDIEARIYADQGTYLCDDILTKVDRDSMLNSLEVRVPFLDHRIVEFANSLPLRTHLHDNEQKHLLKRLLKSRVPDRILTRQKKGFGMPIREWLRGSYRDLAEDLLLSPNNRSHHYLDAKTIRSFFQAHLRGPRDLSDRLWSLMCFEQWCRTFDS